MLFLIGNYVSTPQTKTECTNVSHQHLKILCICFKMGNIGTYTIIIKAVTISTVLVNVCSLES